MLDKIGVSEKDAKIISYYMDNPNIPQSEIAKKMKLSQPSINARVQKLMKKGLLNFHVGINFNKNKLFLMRVDFTAANPEAVLKKLERCSFFVNGFVMSGKNNLSVFLVCEDLRKIDEIINTYIRSDSGISDISTNIVVSTAKDFIFRINMQQELHKCDQLSSCDSCDIMNPEPDVKIKDIEK